MQGDFDIHIDASPAEWGALKTMARRQRREWKDHYATKDGRYMFSTLKLGENSTMYIHKLDNKDMHRKVAIHNENYSQTLFRVSGRD